MDDSPLHKFPFTEADWEEVQAFDCGDLPGQVEVSDWLKAKFGDDGALTTIRNTERPGKVWLYRLADDTLVGFGAMAKTEWRWKGKKDPKIPLTVLLWFGLQKEFHRQPLGPPENRYSSRILEDLIGHALDEQETHPVLGLCVRPDNEAAIKLYKRYGFTESLDPFIDKASGVTYGRMALILNPDALRRVWDAAKAKK